MFLHSELSRPRLCIFSKHVRDDCIESRAKINKQQSYVGVAIVRVRKGCVECCDHRIFSGSVCSPCKLMIVKLSCCKTVVF